MNPLALDATGQILTAHAAASAEMRADHLARERALAAGVPLLTLALVGDLTPDQRLALFACWPKE